MRNGVPGPRSANSGMLAKLVYHTEVLTGKLVGIAVAHRWPFNIKTFYNLRAPRFTTINCIRHN